MARIDELLRRQTERLDRLTDAEARALVEIVEQARKELEAKLQAMVATGADEHTPWTAQRTRAALALVREAVEQLRERLDAQLTLGIERTRRVSHEDLLEVIREFEPEFLLTGNDVPLEALRRVSADRGLALHRYSLHRYSEETVAEVQARLSVSLAKGESLRDTIEAVAGVDGVVAKYGRERAKLIARMETSRAYNGAHREGIETFAEIAPGPEDDPVLKKIIEIRDHRNHPASRVAHGLTARPGEPFRLPVDAVEAEAIKLYRQRHPATRKASVKVTGVVWRLVGDHWEGEAPPIHFNDRSRVVPWRASWAKDGAANKPPRGKPPRPTDPAHNREAAKPPPPPRPDWRK